ncbi:hypothetical protein [Metabacillus idriensis]|uniref:hypothetical protein n=1 Tax=Metabacillus idriensis TaxID=324768 RepID=UPI00174CCB2D|nr:hypothetical protein [Metabacillus idriensis]
MKAGWIIVFILLLGGCANPSKQSEIQPESHKGSELKQTGKGVSNERGTTEQNPNFLNLSKNREQNEDEMDKLQEAIRNDKSLKIDNVTMNGNTIWVDVASDKELTQEEKQKKQAELQTKMQNIIPRYDIKVNLDTK